MLIKRKKNYWNLSRKKELCCCLKLLHVSVLLTLIYFDFQERNEHHNSQGMLCLPLCVSVNTKGCPPQFIVQEWETNNCGRQSHWGFRASFRQALVFAGQQCYRAPVVNVLLWAWTATCPNICCLPAWRPQITQGAFSCGASCATRQLAALPHSHTSPAVGWEPKEQCAFQQQKILRTCPKAVIIQLEISQHFHD